MKHRKLTLRNLAITKQRAKIQILLFMIFIPSLAVPGRAQVTSRVKEQSKNSSLRDKSQAQIQADTLPEIDSETLPSEQGKQEDQRQPAVRFDIAGNRGRFMSRWAKATAGEASLVQSVDLTSTKNTTLLPSKTTDMSSGSTAVQTGSDLSNFAVFFNAGATVPHGDFSTFVDPSFSLNTGLEYMITSQFSAEGTLGFHRFSTNFGFFGGNTNLYQVSANAKFYFVDESSNVRPFINGGAGIYVSDSATIHFGGNVGGGVLYQVTPRVGLQGSYNFHVVNTSSNVRFSTVQGGIRFRF